MQLYVQGEVVEVGEHCTLGELLQQMELAGQRLAVEINHTVIPRSAHAAHRLQAGDHVEIVRAIGGG